MKDFMSGLQLILRKICRIEIRHLQMLFFCCMVVGYYYFGYVDVVGTLSLGVISLTVLFSISYLNYCVRSGSGFSSSHATVSIVLILLAFWMYVVNDDRIVQLMQRFCVPIMLIVVVRDVIKYVLQVKNVLYIIAILVSISCIVAVLQAIGLDLFWNLRMLIAEPVVEVRDQIIRRLRAPGLALFSVPLSYQISGIFPFLLYLNYSTQRSRTRKNIIVLGLSLLLGAMAAKAISGVLAVLVSYFVFMKLNGYWSFKKLLSTVLIGAVLVICMSFFNQFATRLIKPTASVSSRIPSTLIATRILLNNPLGIKSTEEITRIKRYYLAGYENLQVAETIMMAGFHNCLLDIGISNGWMILMVYIGLYYCIFRVAYKGRRNSIRGSTDFYFYTAAIAYLCGYMVQSSTHTAGLTSNDPFDWLMVGVILAYKPSPEFSNNSNDR
ncbi:MAG: hypothetical protein HOG49_06985 [Candidatus Scalindua sp.]|jgi:hypothetical protein|nr:hypothetical protein [Candidatus Scalindua sp.]